MERTSSHVKSKWTILRLEPAPLALQFPGLAWQQIICRGAMACLLSIAKQDGILGAKKKKFRSPRRTQWNSQSTHNAYDWLQQFWTSKQWNSVCAFEWWLNEIIWNVIHEIICWSFFDFVPELSQDFNMLSLGEGQKAQRAGLSLVHHRTWFTSLISNSIASGGPPGALRELLPKKPLYILFAIRILILNLFQMLFRNWKSS